MNIFKYTDDGCVVDDGGFIIALYADRRDARESCQQANEQIAKGEDQQTVERRLRDWAAQMCLESAADSDATVHYAD